MLQSCPLLRRCRCGHGLSTFKKHPPGPGKSGFWCPNGEY